MKTMSMRGYGIFAGAALATAMLAAPTGVYAQDSASMQVGKTTVSVGGGYERLILPDVNFTTVEDNNFFTTAKQENLDSDDAYGFAVNGGIKFPFSGPSGNSKTAVIEGFYSHIEDDDTVSCNGIAGTQRCGWAPISPGVPGTKAGLAVGTVVRTDREVDHWGVSAEGRRQLGGLGGMKDGPTGKQRYVALGADVRGIHQDISINGNDVVNPANALVYNEDLDTTYYGLFVAFGGDYRLPFFAGATSRWGLQSSFRVWGGAYFADTDYRGSYASGGPTITNVSQSLSLSSDDAAFIGGLTLETRKAIGPRATLALRSDYTYYSWVPDMRYNDFSTNFGGPGNLGTSIQDDDAFSSRTTLRLNVTLGPRDVVQPYK